MVRRNLDRMIRSSYDGLRLFFDGSKREQNPWGAVKLLGTLKIKDFKLFRDGATVAGTRVSVLSFWEPSESVLEISARLVFRARPFYLMNPACGIETSVVTGFKSRRSLFLFNESCLRD